MHSSPTDGLRRQPCHQHICPECHQSSIVVFNVIILHKSCPQKCTYYKLKCCLNTSSIGYIGQSRRGNNPCPVNISPVLIFMQSSWAIAMHWALVAAPLPEAWWWYRYWYGYGWHWNISRTHLHVRSHWALVTIARGLMAREGRCATCDFEAPTYRIIRWSHMISRSRAWLAGRKQARWKSRWHLKCHDW